MATSHHPAPHTGHEKSDASARKLLYFVLVVAAILAVMSFSLIGLFNHFEHAQHPGSVVAAPFAAQPAPPPAPRIQPNPLVDMQTYHQSQENVLNTYGWIDRQNGIVRLPIDRAMQLLLQRGLPVRSEPQHGNSGLHAAQNSAISGSPQPGGSLP